MGRLMSNGPWGLCLLLLLCVPVALSIQTFPPERASDHVLARRQNAPASQPLLDFQIYEPVLVPSPAPCTQLLMSYVFAFSYGKPFVGEGVSHAVTVTCRAVITLDRHLYSTFMLLQSSSDQLYRHEQRRSVRPPRHHVSWRYRSLPNVDC